ncbi:MAG: GNAT family N-acetyltransferase [Bacteroidales bacterium]|nr:GNAT family N-acetyltransferase [Bacteroidales bacterium]
MQREITLRRVWSANRLAEDVTRLIESSFPEDERRNTKEFLMVMDRKPMFGVYAIMEGETFRGVVTTWNFGKIVYVEHLAVEPGDRGQGIGGIAIGKVCEAVGETPVVVEVECPTDDMTRRRVEFYERAGFKIWEAEYRQPPYSTTQASVEMRLMARGMEETEENFSTVVGLLKMQVYGGREAVPAIQ